MKAATARFQFDCHGIDWQELERLFEAGNLGGRKGNKVRRAFENSQVVCFVTDKQRLIGAGRALTDGEYHGVIYDIVVHPEHQRQGIGLQLVKQIIERLPVWRIMLVADTDVQPFYAKIGFRPYADVMARLDQDRLYDTLPRGPA